MSISCSRSPTMCLRRLLATLVISVSALSASALAAGKISGDISLPIGSRPTIPASINWSDSLLTQAEVALEAKKTSPESILPTPQAWVGPNFSLHHTLPQTSMQALYQLTQTATSDISNDSDKQAIVTALTTLQASGAGTGLILGRVVWAPVNLFEGLVGYYRSDDPHDAAESSKPKSMTSTRWSALQNVNAALLAVGQLSADGTRFVLNAKKLNAQGGLHTLSTRLTALAAQTTASPLPFTASDWVNNAGKAVQLTDLVVYRDSTIVTAINQAKSRAYQLKR